MKRILVTGASGFVGRALVAHLAGSGYAVRAASRKPLPKGEGVESVPSPDLAGKQDWTTLLRGVDAVVHAAAIAHTGGIDEARYDSVNHLAVLALAQAAQGRVERLVFLSSIRAQSGASAARVLTEADAPEPLDAYGRSKLAAEEGLRRMGARAVILRPVLVVGSQPSGNLATMLRLARLNLPLRLDGLAARRSIVARDDLCRAVVHALQGRAEIGETYIVAHPDPISIGEMFAALRQGLGRRPGGVSVPGPLLRGLMALPVLRAQRDNLLGDLVVSPAKLMATGFTPMVAPHAAMLQMATNGVRS
ncbi:UDP-glucose 4-epimerase [Rhizobiales bacterium GAS113]|nr:UDP-glucose 4-epimerase [Rhizobiales bacterium GAS113]